MSRRQWKLHEGNARKYEKFPGEFDPVFDKIKAVRDGTDALPQAEVNVWSRDTTVRAHDMAYRLVKALGIPYIRHIVQHRNVPFSGYNGVRINNCDAPLLDLALSIYDRKRAVVKMAKALGLER